MVDLTSRQIGRNKICVTLTQYELNEQQLEFDSLSYSNKDCREFLQEIYKRAAVECGLKPEPARLIIELYPYIDCGCLIIYTASHLVARAVSFFCRFECDDDMLDCFSKQAVIEPNIERITLYQLGEFYYAEILPKSKCDFVRSFFSEYADFKCCQKCAFYSEFATEIYTKKY